MAKSFTGAMKEYFGVRPGDTIGQFATELKALNAEEKAEFHRMLVEQAGIQCDPPGTVAAKPA